ncbi:hypothetical protein RIF29_30082 [Crotalaria pallida]|uniref:Uncharacterized protein n=1 Tax=Crotalaria pallida TaxID=3830 RepID=A0AAN9HUG1_CROPI
MGLWWTRPSRAQRSPHLGPKDPSGSSLYAWPSSKLNGRTDIGHGLTSSSYQEDILDRWSAPGLRRNTFVFYENLHRHRGFGRVVRTTTVETTAGPVASKATTTKLSPSVTATAATPSPSFFFVQFSLPPLFAALLDKRDFEQQRTISECSHRHRTFAAELF